MSMRAYINFYDPRLRIRRDWLGLDIVLGSGLALALLLVLAGFILDRQVRAIEAQASAMTARVEVARQQRDAFLASRQRAEADIRARIEATGREIEAGQGMLALIEATRGGSTASPAEALRALARQRQEGLWLTEVRMENGLQGLQLHGRALDAERIPGLVARLGREPVFAGTRFQGIEVKPPKTEAEAAGRPAYIEFSLGGIPATEAGGP